jgi:alpha-tubulin suppressor-like RCC1 family protein
MQIRTPAVALFLQDVALRDLAVHASHAVCVDGRGDVYQWGDGFFEEKSASDDRRPVLTLQGKVRPPLTFTVKLLTTALIFRGAQNITRVQVTESRVFALSASGKVYVISSEAARQKPSAGALTPSGASWWGTGWFWGGETGVQHLEIEPAQQLTWREK